VRHWQTIPVQQVTACSCQVPRFGVNRLWGCLYYKSTSLHDVARKYECANFLDDSMFPLMASWKAFVSVASDVTLCMADGERTRVIPVSFLSNVTSGIVSESIVSVKFCFLDLGGVNQTVVSVEVSLRNSSAYCETV